MTIVAIVYHSGFGHTEKQAEAVGQGAREGGAEVDIILATDLQSPDTGPWDRLDAADAIIFGSPTYMGSVSGPFEMFADATSKRWFAGAWKDKLAAGFTCSSSFSGDKQMTLMRMCTLAMQHSMLWVSLGLMSGRSEHPGTDPENLNRLGFYFGAAAQAGNVPADQEPEASDLATAAHLGRRVATLAGQRAKAVAAG